jgi:hypothetical protein
MRRFVLLFGVAAACAPVLQPAVAQRQCASQADQAVFDVQALRSELMVLATGCKDDESYNAFIRRYQPELLANDRAVDAYFKSRFGRTGQREHDRFITDLANTLSREGSHLGGDFCPRNGAIFHEVMALHGASELPAFAAGKDLVPASLELCQGPAAPLPAGNKAKPKSRKPGLKTAQQ